MKIARKVIGERSVYFDRFIFQLGSRTTVLDAVIEHYGRQRVFCHLGSFLSVKSVDVEGELGTFTGSIDDFAALGTYMQNRTWAPQLTRLLRTFFKSGGTFIDVGANIGLTLVPVANNRSVRCYGFEPEPLNFSYLARNVAANCKFDNVRLYQLALFDKSTTLPFELATNHSGDHRIQINRADGAIDEQFRPTIQVKSERLDALHLDLQRPLAVKIDTQGAEPNIFAGGRETLAKADLIAFEFWPYGMRRIGGDVSQMIDFVADTFAEGSIAVGDKESEDRTWRPIKAICAELRQVASDPITMDDYLIYFDVFVRKQLR
jgi:FkbM family methyltransferase